MKESPPLVVDLDGTLIKSDLLYEGFYLLLRRHPLLVLLVPFWLLRGKAFLKHQIAERVNMEAASLPYNMPLLEFLYGEHKNGRELVLATAASGSQAQEVAKHLGIFSQVLASNENINLSAKQKLKALLEKYGEKGFDYVGNSSVDYHIFPHARNGILVNSGTSLSEKAKHKLNIKKVFESKSNKLVSYFKAVRVYQWLKNLLLFIPLVIAHEWQNVPMLINVAAGFLAFSLSASGGYLFNDFLDLSSDRTHPRKRNRPLASGEISIISGTVLMLVLPAIGLLIASFLNRTFFGVLIMYMVLTIAYSLRLKKYMLIDVLVLAGLYTVRVIAGGEVVNVTPSFWLLAFSIFIFYSLALVKRCSELFTIEEIGSKNASGRDYRVADLDYLKSMGIASGYLSVIVVALYVNSSDVTILYSSPKMLWLICPLLLHWISRVWLKTGRGEMTDDPILFAVSDRVSQCIAVAMVSVICLAI